MLSSSQTKESTYLDSFDFYCKLFVNAPVIQSDFNRAADPEGIVTQNILVRRGLGREPQQAGKDTRSATADRVIFRVCGYTSIACTVTKTVYLQMKLDNHFTHIVFWILHELGMMKP